MQRVIAAMSGGVDSAVAAGILAEQGFEVIGVTMKMYAPTRPAHARSCCGSDDFDDARRCAALLGIPHYVLDFEEAFRREVVDRFAAAYDRGRTPNPCVDCNAFVKLGTLRRFAQRVGAAFVATGHYARLAHGAGGPRLFAASDAAKDQSYALAALRTDQLAGLLLPLGERTKAQTRAEARRLGLPVEDKPDSQDICFVEGGDYRAVLERSGVATHEPGAVQTTGGERIGTHAGIANFTVGQRRGLPPTHFNDGPRYVVRIERDSNVLVIGREGELGSPGLEASGVNLLRPELFAGGAARVRAMTRYRAPLAPALATVDGDTLRLAFDSPERAVAPGQLVALYDEHGEVLGAATIERAT
jgi:tRNA-specific 2-thiouridylase